MIQCQGLRSSLTLDIPISGNGNSLIVVITLWCNSYLNLATKYSILLSANSIRAHTLFIDGTMSLLILNIYSIQIVEIVIT